MKYRKIAVITTIVLASGLTTSAVLANSNQTHPKPIAAVQFKEQKPVQKDTTTQPETASTAPTEAVNTPVNTQTVDVTQENKNKLQQVVTTKAQQLVALIATPSNTQAQLDYLVSVQWACIDRFVSNSIGYADYNAAYNTAAVQTLMTSPQPNGNINIFSDIGTCNIQVRLPYNSTAS